MPNWSSSQPAYTKRKRCCPPRRLERINSSGKTGPTINTPGQEKGGPIAPRGTVSTWYDATTPKIYSPAGLLHLHRPDFPPMVRRHNDCSNRAAVAFLACGGSALLGIFGVQCAAPLWLFSTAHTGN